MNFIHRNAARSARAAAVALLLAAAPAARAATLTIASGGAVPGGNVDPETSTSAVRLKLTASGGTVTVSSLAVSLGAGVGGASVRVAQLWQDNDANGVVSSGDTLLATGGWSAAKNKFVFGVPGLQVTTAAAQNLLVMVGVGVPFVNGSTYGPTTSSTFAVTAAASDLVVDAGNTASGSLTGASYTITTNAPAEGSTTASTTVPVIAIVNPADGASVTPTTASASPANAFKVQVQVYSGSAISSVKLGTDNGKTWPITAALNSRYNATLGANAYVYEATVTVCASGCNLTTPGIYTLRAQATNAGGTVNSAAAVVAVGGAGKGGGTLLVRDNSNELCIDCHAIASHSSQTTNDAKYGSWATTCRDCHTPHRTTNLKLVKNVIAPPSVNGLQSARQSNFAALTGDSNVSVSSGNFGSASFANADSTGPCQVCHTRTQSSGGVARWRNTGNSDTHYTAAAGTQACTGCHDHASGFKPGESSGGKDCSSCHNGIYASMTTGGVHYHDVQNATTTYPTAAPTSGTDPNRKCLMCHVDHDIFRPDINTANGGRGKNLRTDITLTPTTSSNFTNRDFDKTLANGGICTSCHKGAMTRGYADPSGGTTTMVISPSAYQASAHTFSGANTTATFADAPTTLTSTMVGDCGKCHDDTSTKSYQQGYPQAAHNSTLRNMNATLGITAPADPLAEKMCYRCHSRTTDTTPGGGPAKSTAGRDWFNAANMSPQSELIFNVFSNNATYPFDHPVGTNSAAHDAGSGEGAAANDGSLSGTSRHVTCADCHDPHAAPAYPAAQVGSVTAYTVGAAPNPDTLTDSTKAWTANQWVGWTVVIRSGTGAGMASAIYGNTATGLSVQFATDPVAGSTYVITNAGRSNGNQDPFTASAWGLAPTWPTQPTPPTWNDTYVSPGTGAPANPADITSQYASITTWNRTTGTTIQGQTCIKCHSSYAYGSTPPSTPSGLPNSSTTAWGNTAGGTMTQSDLANQFNPNNLSHHAVFAPGKNQPIVSSDTTTSTYNPNWPAFTTGTVTATSGSTAITFTSAAPVTVIPGWFIYIGSAAPAQAAAGWYQIALVNSTTSMTLNRAYTGATGSGKAFMLTAGLGNAFVPPFGPWSTLQCSDCHTSDQATDPFGPHGSGTKWLLRQAVAQTFLFWNGTAVVSMASSTGGNSSLDPNNFCLNCHRRDVYGDYNFVAASSTTGPWPAYNTYSRQNHPIDAGKNHSLVYKNKWGIVCMNCHGGARSGTIHGTNLGQGYAGAAGSYSGKRLLAGSTWYGVTRSSTTSVGACWTKGTTDSVDNCAHTHTATLMGGSGGLIYSGDSNYNYDSNP